MSDLATKSMKDGAWGLSTGLIYNPGTYAKTPELITLAKVASSHGGFYASHIRDEGSEVFPAINEALTIGKEANMPVHISHIKVSGRSVWGKSGDVLALLMQARKDGIKVTADQYPYIASSTSLTATVVPSRFREGERAELVKRFEDPELGVSLRKAISNSLESKNGGADLRIAYYAPKPGYAGKNSDMLGNNWEESYLQLFNVYDDVDFVSVTPNGRYKTHDSWLACANFRQISHRDMVVEADL
jgi:N-acyl-D-aspartate/D-glutamate deacylase